MISFIVAVDKKNGIGKDNQLPWRLPEDLKYFKRNTEFKTIILGRKTMQSLPGILPKRKHIMLSKKHYPNEGMVFNFQNIDDVLTHIKEFHKDQEVFVIGGSEIFNQFMKHADKLYITYIDEEFECDTFFNWDEKDWELYSEEKGLKDEDNPYDYYFRIYNKKR